jgi:thiopurine S-methyltransferase
VQYALRMQPDFWHQRWAGNQIGFHESQVNPLLVAHFDVLGVAPGARVFLPLCGKTLDIDWLLARGYHVAGAELSSLAVAQLFERLGAMPVIRNAGALECWSAAGLDVFVGDIFELTAAVLGAVDAVYDRAALIALPAQMRRQYASHLQALTGCVPQLLVTLQYDQQRIDGPPFSVPDVEVREHSSGRSPTVLARHAVPGGLKGKCPAEEIVWKI